jgi:hypothetical protein
MYLTIDRTAVLALVAAVVVLAAVYRPRVLVPALVAGAVIVVIGATTGFGSPFRHQLGSAVLARASLWGLYLEDFRPLGRGPAAAGSAYKKVAPKPAWAPPLRIPAQWDVRYDRIVVAGEQFAIAGTYLPQFPGLIVAADVRAIGGPAGFRIDLKNERNLIDRPVPADRFEGLTLRLPPAHAPERSLDVAVTLPRTARRATVPSVERSTTKRVVNIVTNPSLESGTAQWVAYEGIEGFKGASIARVTSTSRFGSASLAVRRAGGQDSGPMQGGAYLPFPVKSGSRHTLSLYLRGARAGQSILISVQGPTMPGAINTAPFAIGTSWTRHVFAWQAPTTDPFMAIYIRNAAATGRNTFFVDGLQIEHGNAATPYCDGSVDHCLWVGAAHGSESYRAASTRLADSVGAAPAGTVDEIHVSSAWLPMPQRPPFTVAIDAEELQVLSTPDITTYRVRRGANGTLPAAHRTGASVWDDSARIGPAPVRVFRLPPGTLPPPRSGEPAVDVRDLRIDGLPPRRTPAERIWQRWFERTPAALQSDGPGLVDNLYVSWIWQYGLLGLLICVGWLAVLIRPMLVAKREPAAVTAALLGIFLIVGAFAVNIWEEAPTDVLTAVVLALGFAAARETA